MIMRIVTLAAGAAIGVAAPANALSIRVPTAGKTIEQLQADIHKAARSVCFKETAKYDMYEFRACRRATAEAAMAGSGIPDLVAISEPADTLASR